MVLQAMLPKHKSTTKRVMQTPKALDLEITHQCNLRCSYCSFFTSASDVKQELPTEEWLPFFGELNRCAVLNVTLSGGEVFCRNDLPDLIEGIVQNRMRFNLLSNGTLISEEIAEFLASTGRCDGVQVSIDGASPFVHDSHRGQGNFARAIKGIELLLKHEIPVPVRVTIHKQNVRDLENIARLLLEEIGLPGFSTNSAGYMGLCRQNSEQVQLTIEEHCLAMETLVALNQEYENRIQASAGPLANVRMWTKMEDAFQAGEESLEGKGTLSACNGVFHKLAVRPDGVIVPCSLLSHIELGKINQCNLRDVWANHPELEKLRHQHVKSLKDFDFCKGCDYIAYCTGGCPGSAYYLMQDAFHPSSNGCYKRFLEAGGRLPAYS